MNFNANSGIWGTMFGVPCIVADNFLKLATGEQLKVLLYILRCSGKECTDEEIALNTGITPQQATDAIMFWQQVNVLTADNSSTGAVVQPMQSIMTPPVQNTTQIQSAAAAQPTDSVSVPSAERPRKQSLTPTEISRLMKESEDISELFRTAESIMGVLNHTQQNSLIWLYSYLGLKKEVIITLLSYCVSIEKTNCAYIEKIACSWSENDINNLEIALEEVSRMKSSREYTAQVMRSFEMKRNPTSSQAEIIAQWKAAGFGIELLHYAYEKTVEKIDKLSFAYINKILLSWQDSGFKTVSDVKNAESEFRNRRNNDSSGGSGDDFDVDKYKAFINNF